MWGLDFALGQTATDVRIETFKIETDISIFEENKNLARSGREIAVGKKNQIATFAASVNCSNQVCNWSITPPLRCLLFNANSRFPVSKEVKEKKRGKKLCNDRLNLHLRV